MLKRGYRESQEIIKKNKLSKKNDSVVLIWGPKVGVAGTTDTIRVVKT